MPLEYFRSNPTSITSIQRPDVTLTLRRNKHSNKVESFSVKNINIDSYGFPDDAYVYVIAYSDTFEKRIELGKVKNISLRENISLSEYETTVLTFRLIIREPVGYCLLASCEGIKANVVGDEEESRDSLLHTEYEDLGERLFTIKLSDGSRPVLLVNDSEKLDLRSRIESRDPYIRGLIVPQALEQGLIYLSINPPPDDDPKHWQNIWLKFFKDNGIEGPEEVNEITDLPEAIRWAKEAVERISEEIKFASLAAHALEGD